MKKYSVEFLGAFFITLAVVLATNNPATVLMAPLAVGAMLAVMTYAGIPVSGAHFNPAVTLAVLIRSKIERSEAAAYIVAQVFGSIIAAAIGAYLHSCGGESAISLRSNHDFICSILAEFLGAFVLVFVWLKGMSDGPEANNGSFGLVVGSAFMAAMYIFGGISGGVFNPAIDIGAALTGMYAGADLWIYILGALVGGAAAATVFTLVTEAAD